MENLTPNSLYEVVFVVKLVDPAQGWEVPVNFKPVLPTGETKERQENMTMLGRNRWVEILAGEFRTSPEYIFGKIEFSMYEVKGGLWKIEFSGRLSFRCVANPRIKILNFVSLNNKIEYESYYDLCTSYK